MKPQLFLKKRQYSSGKISISGPSAVGKSSVSKALASILGMKWFDLDELICKNANLATTKEVLTELGHLKFKQIQNQELKNLFSLPDNDIVFACGGEIQREGYDVKLINENRNLIKAKSYNICLIPSDDINEIVEILYPRLNDGKRDARTEGIEGFKKYVEPAIAQYFELADLIIFVHDADLETVTKILKGSLL
jgi:shikimate kinase